MTREALADYVEDNHESLISFVRRRLNETAERDSEDIVQDVILRLLDGPAMSYPVIDISAYVFRALRNRIIDEYRKPRKTVHSMDEPDENELTLQDIIPDLKYEPEDSYRREALTKEIHRAIEDLPEKQRNVIQETEFNGASFKELEERWQTPMGTLLARKHRGLKLSLIHI